MKAIEAIQRFQSELREFGAEQFGTDNMQTAQACIRSITVLSELRGKIQDEALQMSEWPAARTNPEQL